MPFVAGLMVRIGEGGDVYSQPGWDYSSKIAVTGVDAVRAMLRALLYVAGTADKDLIFRTWSVGVGAVGDLHTNPESYDEVLGGIDDPHLIVSTKYTLGDFYSHLPFNGTLTAGAQRRIVEFQARREFEGFGALPNDLTGLHQQALRQFLAANPHVEGIWTWTQDGGPLRAGPMTLYLRTGFWQLYDLNAYTLGRLAQDPDVPAAQLTADWVRQTFSNDPATVAAVCEMFAMSREAVTKGLYIGAYADRSVRALGLEPPPMMWIFEWDIVTGDSAALDSIYAVTRDQGADPAGAGAVDAAVAEGSGRWNSPAACGPRSPRPTPPPGTTRCCGRSSSKPWSTRQTCSARSGRTGPWCCGTRSGSTPATAPPTTRGTRPRAATRPPAPRTSRGTAGTWICPRTTSPPPTWVPPAPTGTSRWRGWPGRCSWPSSRCWRWVR
ncbi:hypothetical protein GCM10027610_095190 [Dactylosporangium cerinum]